MKNNFLESFVGKSIFSLFALLVLLSFAATITAQEAGNAIYNPQQQRRPIVRSSGVLTGSEGTKDIAYSYYLEANILMNVKADEYIVSFGVAQTGLTAQESEQKVDNLIGQFKSSLSGLGVQSGDTFVDFITQTKIYDYNSTNKTTATEKLVGYETKKNIMIRYTNRDLLQQITNAATRAQIFDLIKVDYVITNLNQAKARLLAEAVKIVKQKEELYGTLGIKLKPVAVIEERYNSFQPNDLYQAYQAYETGDVSGYKRVVQSRKQTTSYYQPLDPNDFDLSINNIGLEPLVQCTLFLRVKYYPTVVPILPEPSPSPTPKQ